MPPTSRSSRSGNTPPDRHRRVAAPEVDAGLCDRDGTLVVDVPYNGDPARVVPPRRVGRMRLPQAAARLADRGVPPARRRPRELRAHRRHGRRRRCGARRGRPAGAGAQRADTATGGGTRSGRGPPVGGGRPPVGRGAMSAHPEPPARSALPADRSPARSTAGPPAGHRPRVLVARLDNLGDVLLTGPAVRAVATRADVVFLCGPRGRAAVDLLPGVGQVIEWEAPWIDPEPHPVSAERCRALVEQVEAAAPTSAALLGSSHQSPLPLALLLRLAGVERLAAVSHDYAGSLLDHRIPGDPDVHEVERSLGVVRALGFPAPGDDRLAVRAAFEREAR